MAAGRTGTGWLVAVQDGATTVSPSRDEVVAFDLEGRPSSWFREGHTYKRSLASQVFGRRTVAGVRRRWRVPDAEAAAHFARALAVARDLHDRRGRERSAALDVDAAALEGRLERILAWTPERVAGERERFDQAYAPISILPPDQYTSVVLQATFGCSWNRCTYCTFYQDRPFQARDLPAFAEHVTAVKRLLGRAAAARRRVFLADGNALVLANAKLRPLLATARDAFPERSLAGFVDVFSGERKPVADWHELRTLGLERVAIGLETGHDPLLRYLNKPGGADEATEFVATLKAAGLRVAVIFMVGAGGRRFAVGHVRDSAALLARLPLTAGDIVYLSPFVVQPGSAYAARAAAEGLEPLDTEARTLQYRALRDAARAGAPAARVALYHLDEFVY